MVKKNPKRDEEEGRRRKKGYWLKGENLMQAV